MIRWLDQMNKQLSKKEKKIKLIEARKRAILWSEREIWKKQLKAQSRIESISISDPSTSSSLISRHSEASPQALSESTVASLQKTIKELKIQRQELDITIKVLSNHLQQLLNKKPSHKSHKRSKTDG